MTKDADLERRVDRLENDTESIYELVGEFRAEFLDFGAETRGRFDRIEQTLVEVVRRLPEPPAHAEDEPGS